MKPFQFISDSQESTKSFASNVAKILKPGDLVCLFGDLGSGKTTFVKGLAQAFSVNEKKVNSPTFVLMNEYSGKTRNMAKKTVHIYHFDLYRLDSMEDIHSIGYEEFFFGEGIAVVEWADRLGELMPKEYIKIVFKHQSDHCRKISFQLIGEKYNNLNEKKLLIKQ